MDLKNTQLSDTGKKIANLIIWEMHGFSHPFLIIRENATKPIVWGKLGNLVATGFGLTLSVYDILDLGLRNTQHKDYFTGPGLIL